MTRFLYVNVFAVIADHSMGLFWRLVSFDCGKFSCIISLLILPPTPFKIFLFLELSLVSY